MDFLNADPDLQHWLLYWDIIYKFFIVLGGTDGCVRVWDSKGTPMAGYLLHPDCVNGVALHPYRPLLATSSGQRQVSLKINSDDDDVNDDDDDDGNWSDNSVRVWQFSPEKSGSMGVEVAA